jgi:1-acyl-sn-glycerol-3-phosphate acyltransferase
MLRMMGVAWYHIARCLCGLFVILCFGFRVYNRQNVPTKGAFLLLSNHQSYLDPIFCAGLLPMQMGYMARDTLFKNWFFGRLIRSVNAIPVRRGQSDIGAIKAIIEKLNNGVPVCLFPEGTRTTDGRIARVKPGMSLLARRGRVPVVPMVIEGAFEAWPRDRKLFRVGSPIVAYYGKPIPVERIKEMGDEAFAEHLTQVMWKLQNEVRTKLGKEPFDYSEAAQAAEVSKA